MILSVRHTVSDYATWKPAFDDHAASRKEHGAIRHQVLRGIGNPNEVSVIIEFPATANAEAFLADPSLAEAMKSAGVQGAPTITLWDPEEEVVY